MNVKSFIALFILSLVCVVNAAPTGSTRQFLFLGLVFTRFEKDFTNFRAQIAKLPEPTPTLKPEGSSSEPEPPSPAKAKHPLSGPGPDSENVLHFEHFDNFLNAYQHNTDKMTGKEGEWGFRERRRTSPTA